MNRKSVDRATRPCIDPILDAPIPFALTSDGWAAAASATCHCPSVGPFIDSSDLSEPLDAFLDALCACGMPRGEHAADDPHHLVVERDGVHCLGFTPESAAQASADERPSGLRLIPRNVLAQDGDS